MEIPEDKIELWKRLFGNVSPALLKSFKAFHGENKHIYEAFKQRAEQMRAAGRVKYSHWAIINVVRWGMDLTTTAEPYKISNDFITMFARLLVWQDPSFDGFFELKKTNPHRGAGARGLKTKERHEGN